MLSIIARACLNRLDVARHCERSEAINRVGILFEILCLSIATLAPLARNDVGILSC